MLRIQLSPAQRDELRTRTRQPGLAPRTRDRLEMAALWTRLSALPSQVAVGRARQVPAPAPVAVPHRVHPDLRLAEAGGNRTHA